MQSKVVIIGPPCLTCVVGERVLRDRKSSANREESQPHSLQNESFRQEYSPRQEQVLVPHEETAQGQKDPRRDRQRLRGKSQFTAWTLITLHRFTSNTPVSLRTTVSFLDTCLEPTPLTCTRSTETPPLLVPSPRCVSPPLVRLT